MKPYQRAGSSYKILIKKLAVKLPHRALTVADLFKYATALKIPHFRGFFMRN